METLRCFSPAIPRKIFGFSRQQVLESYIAEWGEAFEWTRRCATLLLTWNFHVSFSQFSSMISMALFIAHRCVTETKFYIPTKCREELYNAIAKNHSPRVHKVWRTEPTTWKMTNKVGTGRIWERGGREAAAGARLCKAAQLIDAVNRLGLSD